MKKRKDWKTTEVVEENSSDELLALRKNLQDVLSVGDDDKIDLQEVFNLLVPYKYKKVELENLLIKASAMPEWFIRSDGEVLIVNPSNMMLQKSE